MNAARDNYFLCVISLCNDPDHFFRFRIEQVPGSTAIVALEQSSGIGIHYIGIQRIKNIVVGYTSQVEHAPGRSAGFGDKRSCHITTQECNA